MSAIINFNLRVDQLPKEKFVVGKNGAVYCNLTMSVNDDTNQFGQNASLTVPQTKEEREAKKPKTYLGNGNVVWNNGVIKNAVKQTEQVTKQVEETADLPF